MGKDEKKVEGPALGIDLGTTCAPLRQNSNAMPSCQLGVAGTSSSAAIPMC